MKQQSYTAGRDNKQSYTAGRDSKQSNTAGRDSKQSYTAGRDRMYSVPVGTLPREIYKHLWRYRLCLQSIFKRIFIYTDMSAAK